MKTKPVRVELKIYLNLDSDVDTKQFFLNDLVSSYQTMPVHLFTIIELCKENFKETEYKICEYTEEKYGSDNIIKMVSTYQYIEFLDKKSYE